MADISFNFAFYKLKIAQIAWVNQLFQHLNLVRLYGHGFFEWSRMLMRKNVNNDVSKDSPIETAPKSPFSCVNRTSIWCKSYLVFWRHTHRQPKLSMRVIITRVGYYVIPKMAGNITRTCTFRGKNPAIVQICLILGHLLFKDKCELFMLCNILALLPYKPINDLAE